MKASRAMGPRIARVREWFDPMWAGICRARTFGLAAEMSFWLFLSLVPLAAVAGLVAAKVATHSRELTRSLLASVPPDARTLVSEQVSHVAQWNGRTVAPVALVMFAWLAASGVHAVFDALEVQTGAQRPWWKKRLLALGTCVGLSIGSAILAVLAVGLGRLGALVQSAVPHAPVEGTIAGFLLRAAFGFAIALAMVTGLYRVGIPREARISIPVLPGALLAVVLVTALGWAYRGYVSATGTGDAYQGSLAVIGVTLMTLYLFSVALLIGAELNKVVANRRASRGVAGYGVTNPSRGVNPSWPTSSASSFPRTSPTPPSAPSTGPSP